MSVQLSISNEEARALITCINFVRDNFVFDAKNLRYRNIDGKPISMTIREALGFDFLRDYIETQSELAANARPVNPFFSFN